MADSKVSALTTIPAVDRAADILYIVDTSGGTSNKVTPNGLLGITGAPVGDTDAQTLTFKTITSPAISSPVLSGTITGTYTLGGTPTFPSSVVTLTGSQTLTSKILTSPTINTPTITNPTITVDSLSEFTSANGITIDGLNIKDSKLNTNNSVVTTNITNAAVTADKISLGGATATVATSETTTSTSYTDLATVTDTVTVTIGANGAALIVVSCEFSNSGANTTWMSWAASGANTIAASDAVAFTQGASAARFGGSRVAYRTGLTPGSTTFKAKYRVSGGTGTFLNRNILVIPL